MEISRTEQQSKIDDWRDASGISLWLLLRDYSYISESAIASVYIYIYPYIGVSVYYHLFTDR